MKPILSFLTALVTATSATLAQQPDVSFVTPSIVRVQWAADGQLQDNATGVCVYQHASVEVAHQATATGDEYSTTELIVKVDKTTGAVTFIDRSTGATLLSEATQQPHFAEPVVQERIEYDEASAHTVETANGQVTVRDVLKRDTIGQSTRYRVRYQGPAGEALYGLGSHMEDYMNLVGKTLYLTQHNLKAMVPMLCSTGGYGLLFDAGCAMKFASDGKGYQMDLEAAKELDYYFIKGKTLDQVVAGYRYLTGAVSLMPRYVFGYTQSKERYTSSQELISVLREYRRRHVPIDMIVQDWNYWPQGWGYMKMDPKYYPDPKALADSIHAMNAKLMVSIWPNPQWCPEAEDFKERGMMLPHDVYNVFDPEARNHYWKYANDEFFSRGFDAWWCDSSEPLDGDWNRVPKYGADGKSPYSWNDHEMRWHLNKDVLSEALGAERSSLYSLYHAMGIYENQRGIEQGKRVVNLTRSSYAGEQRYGTIVWNGDTHASWESFRQQIPSGLNYMATGCPYWTVDVGSFFTRNDGRRWFYQGAFPEGVKDPAYREYYLRMFQWATFLPVLRSHGSDTPREIWQFGEPGTPYYDAILSMIHLRYQHVPYLYSMAAAQTFDAYTMARMLAFDFADDANVLDIKDQYMLGSYLVCPVTRPLSETTTRRLYLPKGAEWVDYHTGRHYEGGQWLDYQLASLNEGLQMPLFVRSGCIIPTTEVADYTDAQEDLPVTLHIYPGADATFSYYYDDGTSYLYELADRYARIAMKWDDHARRLTIGDCKNALRAMKKTFRFIVVTPDGQQREVNYTGKRITVKM